MKELIGVLPPKQLFFFPSKLPSLPSLTSPTSNPRSSHHCSSLRCSTSSDFSAIDDSSPSRRIFVRGKVVGLSRSTTEGCLKKVFSRFGDVRRVKIILSKGSKQSLGFAYIWFAREEDASLAVNEMDGKFLDGRFIAVMIASPETPTKQRSQNRRSSSQLKSSKMPLPFPSISIIITCSFFLLPTLTISQSMMSMCMSQFALANQACSAIPPEEDDPLFFSLGVHHGHRHDNCSTTAHQGGGGAAEKHENVDNSTCAHHHHHNDDGELPEHPKTNVDCCRWLMEVDNECVCEVMRRLPPFLTRRLHTYVLAVGRNCQLTYNCKGA